jgi:hypothetical protein
MLSPMMDWSKKKGLKLKSIMERLFSRTQSKIPLEIMNDKTE